jgi:hypothetical protein
MTFLVTTTLVEAAQDEAVHNITSRCYRIALRHRLSRIRSYTSAIALCWKGDPTNAGQISIEEERALRGRAETTHLAMKHIEELGQAFHRRIA